MHFPLAAVGAATLILSAAAVQAQDILYYKFDSGCGSKVINYWSESGIAPAEGTVKGNAASVWAAPKFGNASLAGRTSTSEQNYIDTGWNGALNSSFTIAFFMKERSAPPSTSYIISGIGSFRMFTGGVAGTSLWLRAWGGTPADLKLTANVQAASKTAWVHVALVVDTTAGMATWYVDGVAEPAIPISGSTSVTPGTFLVGFHTGSTSAWAYDTDDFRVLGRAATAAEIGAWVKQNQADDGPFGGGCKGGKLVTAGGNPVLGSTTYALNLSGTAGQPFALSIGANHCTLGSINLPLDLGTIVAGASGCNWESSGDLWLGGTFNRSGTATVPLPIPKNMAYDGLGVYTQAVFLDGMGSVGVTNPHAHVIGQ